MDPLLSLISKREQALSWQLEIAQLLRERIMEATLMSIDTDILQAYTQVLADVAHVCSNGIEMVIEVERQTSKEPT